ncbi:DNA-directed RNA polymerase III subunit RPC5-like [Macrosteles quadrilineatus]|uniref:DNA-directed RNA polymerase III subunit RPC5-like n=1 Tax=Macrosteles quadrilineatus TaxID=74068 RepID=UPI0023E0D77A|nr:DNA-directed RNA polymerase III subunit RPC5-like [Macrosteles quadrilineatus]
MSDEEDPVVSEMPVFLSHALENQLFVLQYPTTPAGRSQENDNIIKCSFKPNNQELVMEKAIDTNSRNYDISHGKQIAIDVDDRKNQKPSEKYFQSNAMDKQTLQSTRVITDEGTVAVATVCDGKMIISPIQGVLSVNPILPHLDVTYKRAKEEAKDMGEDVSEEESDTGNKERCQVKFAGLESDKKAKEKSYNFLTKRSAEEKWYETQYHPSSSKMAEVERSKLTAVELEDQMDSMCLTPRQYMDSIVPVQMDPPSEFPSVSDFVLEIIKRVKIMTFSQLSSLAAGAGEPDEVELLRSIQEVAVLVQGNWVINSKCLYGKGTLSPNNGVSAELMCRARDYILYEFSEGKILQRRQVAEMVALPPEEIEGMFSQVAKKSKPKKGWELALPPDNDFIERNPEVVSQQKRAWATKYKQLMETFKEEKTLRSLRRKSSMSGSDLETIRPKLRKDVKNV